MTGEFNLTCVVLCEEGDTARDLSRCLNTIVFQTQPLMSVHICDLWEGSPARELTDFYAKTFDHVNFDYHNAAERGWSGENEAVKALIAEMADDYVVIIRATGWFHESFYELVDEQVEQCSRGFDVAIGPIGLVFDDRDLPLVYQFEKLEEPGDELRYRLANPFWGKVWSASWLRTWFELFPYTSGIYSSAPALMSHLDKIVYVEYAEPLVLFDTKTDVRYLAGSPEEVAHIVDADLDMIAAWDRERGEVYEAGLWSCLFTRAASVLDAGYDYARDVAYARRLVKCYYDLTGEDELPDLAGSVGTRIGLAADVGEPPIPRRIVTLGAHALDEDSFAKAFADKVSCACEHVEVAAPAHASALEKLLAVLREVFERGGIFIKDGFKVQKSIEELFYNEAFFVHSPDGAVSDLAFGARAGHPVVKGLIEALEKRADEGLKDGELAEVVKRLFVAKFGMYLSDTIQYIKGKTAVYESWRFMYPTAESFMSFVPEGEDGRITVPVEMFDQLLSSNAELAGQVRYYRRIVNTRKSEIVDLRHEYRALIRYGHGGDAARKAQWHARMAVRAMRKRRQK